MKMSYCLRIECDLPDASRVGACFFPSYFSYAGLARLEAPLSN